MRHTKPPSLRNKVDLSDATQLRTLKKRLGVSTADLERLIEKVGNCIGAISKQIEQERAPLPEPNIDVRAVPSRPISSTAGCE